MILDRGLKHVWVRDPWSWTTLHIDIYYVSDCSNEFCFNLCVFRLLLCHLFHTLNCCCLRRTFINRKLEKKKKKFHLTSLVMPCYPPNRSLVVFNNQFFECWVKIWEMEFSLSKKTCHLPNYSVHYKYFPLSGKNEITIFNAFIVFLQTVII